jgi:ribokinase
VSASIHVVGSMMIDRVVRVRALPRAGETVAAVSSATFAGGKGANQAAAAAKCGARVRMLGRGGAESRFIVEALREAGVGTWSVSLGDPAAGAATVMVADGGENAIVIAPEANTRIELADIERFLRRAKQGDIVLFQNECSCLHEGIAAAALRGLRVWLNAAPADQSLRALRYEKLAGLVVNEAEAELLTGERDPARALELLAAWMPGGTVIVTLGPAGAIAASGRVRFAHRGFAVHAVDTVGCGDAFVGGYLSAIASGRDIGAALARGNAAGALAAMQEGAMPSLPSRAEVEAVETMPEGARLAARTGGLGGRPSHCESCGYDISANRVGEACPECGVTITASRFGGRWRTRRGRGRFRLAAALFRGAAVLHAIVPALLAFDLALFTAMPAAIAIPLTIVGLFVAVPVAMAAVGFTAADTSGRRRLPWIAASMRLAGFGLLLLVNLPLGRSLPDWLYRFLDPEGALLLIALADGLFVFAMPGLVRGTGVPPISRTRARAMLALAALSAWFALNEVTSRDPPALFFATSSVVLIWSAVEIRLLAKRMRALEAP